MALSPTIFSNARPQPLLNYLDKFPKIRKQASRKQYLLRIYSEPEVQKVYMPQYGC
jgi:hypothetical protein